MHLSFDVDFVPYPEYVEWTNKDGRIWVKTQVKAPSVPTYYFAEVRSSISNIEKLWSIVLYGDHCYGAVFPRLPSELTNWAPTKEGADTAYVVSEVGTVRWLTMQEDPEGSLEGANPWYVSRWKYIVSSSQDARFE